MRDEKVTVTSFVANVGGLLGLCMGFSLVSVVEMVYFCVKEKLFGIVDSIFKTNISSNEINAKPEDATPQSEPTANQS